MSISVRRLLATLLWAGLLGGTASAQTATYHLHREGSPISPLLTAGPDASAIFYITGDLANASPGDYLFKVFETPAGVPGTGGTIPSGSTITFSLWMDKTSSAGTIVPKSVVYLDSGAQLCTATGAAALTTTLVQIAMSCTTATDIAISTTDRFYVEMYASVTTAPGNNSVVVELGVEGTAGGNYDSTITLPLGQAATVTSLTPNIGPTGIPVHVTGTGFHATQGSSTVSFNGASATPTSWSDTGIDVPAPAGATTGPVTVTVGGTASNGVTFTALPAPSLTSLTPSSGLPSDSITIAGSNFLATQGSSTVKFTGVVATVTSWSNTSITATVPSTGTGSVVVTVYGHDSNALTFTVPAPAITSLTPSAAAIGDPVTIAGTNFLASQGSSTVTFNGTAASVTSWGSSSITTSVPAAATTGPVVVTVNGQSSNQSTFTVVTTGTIGGTITRTSNGSALAGATIQAVKTGAIVGTAISASDGTYAVANLQPGTYDVRVLATGYSSELRSNKSVSINVTTTVDVAMSHPGSVSGKVTQSNGTTPIAGAAVTLFLGGIDKGHTNTSATGDYSVGNLHPGSYTAQAVSVGYRTKEQGALVSEDTDTTGNLALDPAGTGPVTYVYDELNRLVTVVDPSGDAATYTYDAVGNILSIGRIAAGTVAITEFTPNGAPVAAPVTVYGTGFSATASQNTITFHGTAAVVTSSTATQIVTSVPAGATSGSIAVTTPSGSATSATSFTVTVGTGAPTISGISPAIAPSGVAVTITGTNFDPTAANDRVTVNETFASLGTPTATSIATTVPGSATSGHISVTTVNGTAVSTDDLFIPPPPYVATDVAFTGRMGYGDAAALTASIGAANKIALVVFDGTGGHRVSLKLSSVTVSNGNLTIQKPQGATLTSTAFTSAGAFLEPMTLAPSSGSYTIVLDPAGTATGNVTLTLYDVPADVTGAIVPGGAAVPVTLGTPGQNARLTFAGTAGQKVALGAGAGPVGTVSIVGPTGTTVGSVATGAAAAFLDTVTLPSAGTYTVLMDPQAANTGSISLTLYNAADITTSISPGGAALNASVPTPGARVVASFTATANQRVSLKLTSLSLGGGAGCQAAISIVDPGGVTLRSATCVTGDTFLDVTGALAAGVHTVVFDPASNRTGSATLTLYNVPGDVTSTITPGGSPVTVTMSTPGQNAALTFTATNQQRISLNLTGVTFAGCTTVTIKRPDGTTVATNGCVTTTGAFIDVQTLSPAGTYTIAVDPSGLSTGQTTLTLYNVPADLSGTITPGGSAVTVSPTTPGQNAALTFTATANQRVSLNLSSVTIGGCTAVTIKKPDGSTVATNACVTTAGAFIDVQTLTPAGTYTIAVDPSGAGSGSMTLTLYNVPADLSGSVTINGAAVPVTFTTPGQNASYTFNGTSGQLATVKVESNNLTPQKCVTVKLFRANGTTQLATTTSCSTTFNLTQQTLPATETYIIKIDPSANNIGTLNIKVTNP